MYTCECKTQLSLDIGKGAGDFRYSRALWTETMCLYIYSRRPVYPSGAARQCTWRLGYLTVKSVMPYYVWPSPGSKCSFDECRWISQTSMRKLIRRHHLTLCHSVGWQLWRVFIALSHGGLGISRRTTGMLFVVFVCVCKSYLSCKHHVWFLRWAHSWKRIVKAEGLQRKWCVSWAQPFSKILWYENCRYLASQPLCRETWIWKKKDEKAGVPSC